MSCVTTISYYFLVAQYIRRWRFHTLNTFLNCMFHKSLHNASNLVDTLNVIIVYFTYFLVCVSLCVCILLIFLQLCCVRSFFCQLYCVWNSPLHMIARAVLLKMAKCHNTHNKFCAIKRVDLCTALEWVSTKMENGDGKKNAVRK